MTAARSELFVATELMTDPAGDPLNVAMEITAGTNIALSAVSALLKEGEIEELHAAKESTENDAVEDPEPVIVDYEFENRFGMSRSILQDLCLILAPHMSEKVVSAEKKIMASLLLLGSHYSFKDVADISSISKGSLHVFLMNVCDALKKVMKDIIIWPGKHRFQHVAEGFRKKTKIPGVVGVIGSTQIRVPAPLENPFLYKNIHNYYSVHLQAVCDSNSKFLDITTGWPGSVHNIRVFRNSPLHTLLEEGNLLHSYHIIGDDTYPLTSYLIVPYDSSFSLTDNQKGFNKAHALTQAAIENAFELLTNKFKRLQNLDMKLVKKVPDIIAATCILHNFIIMKNTDADDSLDIKIQGENMEDIQYQKSVKQAHQKRDELADAMALNGYF